MAKKKTPRKKSYQKKCVRVPMMTGAFIPEYTNAQRTNIGLALLLPVKTLRTPEASQATIISVVTTIKFGACICENFNETGDLKNACILAMASLVAGLEFAERHEPLPGYMVDAVEYAVNRILECEMALDRQDLMRTFEESGEMDARILLVEDGLIGAIIPDVPEVEKYVGLSGLAFVDNRAVRGRLSDAKPWRWVTEEGEEIPITEPIMAYLDDERKNELP